MINSRSLKNELIPATNSILLYFLRVSGFLSLVPKVLYTLTAIL